MGHCGPVDPCELCRQSIFEPSNDWAKDPNRPGSYIINRHQAREHKERRERRPLPAHLRLPTKGTSRRQARRRAAAKRKRTS